MMGFDFSRVRRTVRVAATVVLGGALLGASVAAQTVPENNQPETELNIPKNLQIFGKVDPNVRKATAIVNEAVLTWTDVDQRVALVTAANSLALSDEEHNQLRLQVLSQLIDETLQLQQAKSANVKLEPGDIDRYLERVASNNFHKTLPELRTYLRSIGSSERTLRRQVESQLAWNRYLRNYSKLPKIEISDAEVTEVLNRLKAQQGKSEFRVKEIYLSTKNQTPQQVVDKAQALMKEIQSGKRSFEQAAAEYSDATTAAVGGDLGWVKADALPESFVQTISQMSVNQLAGPIEAPGGFSILYLVDTRQVLTTDARDAVLNLRQISMAFAPGTSEEEATKRAGVFADAIKTIHGCGSVPKIAAGLGAEVVDNASVRLRDLPGPLVQLLENLQIGEATPPFGSPTEGVRTLVLCGRDAPKEVQLPGMEAIRAQMEDQAVSLRAEHKLRDLRRDAVIEYR